MGDEAETVGALVNEMSCESDAVRALWEGRVRDLETLRDLRGDGDRNDVVEADRDREEKFGPTHPEIDDGCPGCGSFAHPPDSCPGEEE